MQLGAEKEDQDIPETAERFSEDERFIALDLSIHWVSAISQGGKRMG